MAIDHFQVVHAGLTGLAPVDDKTLASLAILQDRLEHLKRAQGLFAAVGFSPHVQRLVDQSQPVHVG